MRRNQQALHECKLVLLLLKRLLLYLFIMCVSVCVDVFVCVYSALCLCGGQLSGVIFPLRLCESLVVRLGSIYLYH